MTADEHNPLESLIQELELYLGQTHALVTHERLPDEPDAAYISPINRDVHCTLPAGWQEYGPLIREINGLDLPEDRAVLHIPPWNTRPSVNVSGEQRLLSPTAASVAALLAMLPDRYLTVLLPGSFLSRRDPHDRSAALTRPARLVVALEKVGYLFGAHRSLSLALLHFAPKDAHPGITKFFTLPDEADPEGIRSDFAHLLRQGGGQTRFGFVRREILDPAQSLWPDRWSPHLEAQLADLENLGSTAPLQQLADVQLGVHRALHSDRLGSGILLLRGRDLSRDGRITYDEESDRIQATDDELLRAGDILIRAIQDLNRQDTLVVARVSEEDLPCAADHRLIVVRPRQDMDHTDEEFLLAFLRSPAAAARIRAQGRELHIHARDLAELAVPLPDEPVRTALEQLEESRSRLAQWVETADGAVTDLMKFTGARTAEARSQLFSAGDAIKRRVEAASLAMQPAWQIRNLYPHPIAYPYRTVEAGTSGLEGYRDILRCAEMAMCYLGLCAMSIVRALDDVELTTVAGITKTVEERGHYNLSFGDFIQTVREFSGANSRKFQKLERRIPLEEIRAAYDQEVDQAVASLKRRRDQHAHFREGRPTEEQYQAARSELDILLGSLAFLTAYTLVRVEDVHSDSLAGTAACTYRELHGDHPLVPIRHGTDFQTTLEAGSLYLLDRQDGLYLLRPYMLHDECPTCGRPSTFHLDRLTAEAPGYRSFEHDHSIEAVEQQPALRAVGLV